MKRLARVAAAAAALTAAWLVWREPETPDEPAAALAEPQATLTLPTTAVPEAAPRPAPLTPAPPPSPNPPAAGTSLHVGAEGYGPHIDRAQAGQDPKAGWEAVQWMRLCATNEARRNSFETMRNQGVSPEMMTQLMVEADAEARRCQTVTASHRALLPELAARAMRAGLPEAASAYAGSVFPEELTPGQRQEVAQAMRRDAQAGDVPSLLGAVIANPAWGLDDAERLAYLYAYGALGGPHGEAVVKGLLQQRQIGLKSMPTPEQLASAKIAGEEIVARAGRKP